MSDFSLALTNTEIEALAASYDLIAMFPDEHELQLDYDGDQVAPTNKLLAIAENSGLLFTSMLTTVSKSGKAHVYLHCTSPLKPMERVIIQACMGSDLIREFFSLARIRNGSEYATVLFETAVEATRVKAWRRCHETRMHTNSNIVNLCLGDL